MSKAPRLRCAIYTRKSSDEGLEQDFNSLDAQREACEAYIASQAGLGWRILPDRYDDGGISGGTLERPALQKLLHDIRSGSVDVVVVYKIDRLTRSLIDFARIVEVFDAGAVSFVSVTQAFNTTSSMGRLTLNVLLSFAQFEREVTGERIRDKIAASKRKGMWMGGVVPLGYKVQDRKLVVNEDEAIVVRTLFEIYLECGSIRGLQNRGNALGLVTRKKVDASSGASPGGRPFSCGHLKAILSNPIYIGKIRHRNECHHGQHRPILDQTTFDEVQQLLNSRANRNVTAESRDGIHLLSGLIFDEVGDPLGPTHATKAGKRYRYYVSRRLLTRTGSDRPYGWRLPAEQLDDLVCDHLRRFLRSRAELAQLADKLSAEASRLQHLFDTAAALANELEASSPAVRMAAFCQLVRRIVVARQTISIELALSVFAERSGLGLQSINGSEATAHLITLPVALKRRGAEARLIVNAERSAPDQGLIRLIARSHFYIARLTEGGALTIGDLAERERLDVSDLSRILRLAYLAPEITEAILIGRQPPELTPKQLTRFGELSLLWSRQARQLGL